MSDDTREIEDMLSGFRPAGPDADMRTRVVRRADSRSRWTFIQAMAATLLIGMNLAQISASATQMIAPPRTSEARTRQLANDIARLDLPLSKEETYAMAQRLSAGEGLVPLPIVHGNPSINMNTGAMP